MQSRRDQVQAYFFVVGRLVAGLVQGKPDVLEHPNKRFTNGTVLGVLAAALLVACFGIYGLFVPGGNNTWRVPGAIVLDKDTGARYVYLDGQLRPALNMASALLAGGDGAKLVSVSGASLTGAPVGMPIGIPGAPDGLPAATGLNAGAWTVCAGPAAAQSGVGPTVTLRLDPVSGQSLSDDQGLVVATPDGVDYLVWRGQRHRIADAVTREALGYGTVKPQPVSPAWVNVIPAGRDLQPPAVGDMGKPGPQVNGKPGVIGQIYEVRNPAIGSDELYVLQRDGLMPASRSVAAMLLASPATRAAYAGADVKPIEVGPGAVAGVTLLNGDAMAEGMPSTPPKLADLGSDRQACVRFSPAADGGHDATVITTARGGESTAVAPAGQHVVGATADQVVIPVGTGALVRSVSAPGATPGTQYLVTDLGVRYPLADDSVAGLLGYGQVSNVNVSPELLALLPVGPVLDPHSALAGQPVGGH